MRQVAERRHTLSVSQTFVVYVDWESPHPVDQSTLDAFDAAWDDGDQTFCSSCDGDRAQTVTLSFDRTGSDVGEIAEGAARLVQAVALQGHLPGRVVRVALYDEDRSYDWTPDLG